MSTLIGPPGWIVDQAADASHPVSAPGVIGGAVIRAARRSASLSRRKLARMLAVSPATVRNWENGTRPLFCVRYDQLCQLAEALSQAGAHVGQEADELILASQCDLLITGILRGFEDYAELPPVDQDVAGEAPRGLIRWALTGRSCRTCGACGLPVEQVQRDEGPMPRRCRTRPFVDLFTTCGVIVNEAKHSSMHLALRRSNYPSVQSVGRRSAPCMQRLDIPGA